MAQMVQKREMPYLGQFLFNFNKNRMGLAQPCGASPIRILLKLDKNWLSYGISRPGRETQQHLPIVNRVKVTPTKNHENILQSHSNGLICLHIICKSKHLIGLPWGFCWCNFKYVRSASLP